MLFFNLTIEVSLSYIDQRPDFLTILYTSSGIMQGNPARPQKSQSESVASNRPAPDMIKTQDDITTKQMDFHYRHDTSLPRFQSLSEFSLPYSAFIS